MAVVQMKASDLTGEKGEEEEFGRLIVRRHPALERGSGAGREAGRGGRHKDRG
jgi:hypothetical protein